MRFYALLVIWYHLDLVWLGIAPTCHQIRTLSSIISSVCSLILSNMVLCLASSIEKANPGLLGALPQYVRLPSRAKPVWSRAAGTHEHAGSPDF